MLEKSDGSLVAGMLEFDEAHRLAAAALFLTELLGQPVTTTTLRNWRYQRRGPDVEYYSGRPFYSVGGLRRFGRKAFRRQPKTRRSYRRRRPGTEQPLATL